MTAVLTVDLLIEPSHPQLFAEVDCAAHIELGIGYWNLFVVDVRRR